MSQTLSLEEIYSPIEKRLKAVPAAILDILSTENALAGDVIRYFFSAQGKLLRPALTLLGAEIKEIDPAYEKRLLHLAASFEIFHSATLIHDDIIDSAHLRRSLPTVHTKWSPEVAVLVGDYLHDKAIGAIFQNGNEKIVAGFLETAGVVCDGEIHEIKVKNNFALSETEYLEIVYKKTGSLLATSLECGGRLAGADEREAAALKSFGRWFGIAFQIIDDCLDFTGQEQEFGKTLGKDCDAGVLTLPLIRLLETANPAERAEWLALLQSSEDGASKFQKLRALVQERGTIDYARALAREMNERARAELAIFPENAGKKSLLKLLDYVIERSR